MTKNNKGFMLAEVVITSTVVMTAMIGLYATFTKIYNAYNVRATYYNIDGVYAIRNMLDYLINGNDAINLESGKINKVLSSSNATFKYVIKNSECDGNIVNKNECENIGKVYNVQNMLIVNYTQDALNVLKSIGINQTFIDYLEYISKYYSFNNEYEYLVIVEYKNGDDYNYSSVELR